jgi:hypothetical protein
MYVVLLSNAIHFKFSKKSTNFIQYSIVVFFVLSSIYIFTKINVSTLKVDRWSVITSFWDTFFEGKYPYYAKSHMNSYPGPMPLYFLLAFPFYLLNELGYFSLLALPLLIYLLQKMNIPSNYKLLILIFITTSTFYLWEVASRSNILTNSLLIIWVLTNFIEQKKSIGFYFYFNAILVGLLLSTRAIFILPYIIFFLYSLKKKEVKITSFLLYTLIASITFILTFLPFIIGYKDDFFTMNPFVIQSSFLIPSYYTILFILIAIVFSFLADTKNSLYYYSGLALFISIFIYAVYHCVVDGFNASYFEGKVDISYFIFSVPFFLFYLARNNTFTIENK